MLMIYVCSDIHGRYDRYMKLFDYVKDEDTLYILGDVIDRGPDGMKILLDMIDRKNVIFLIGNHEFMMKRVIEVEDDIDFNGMWFQNWLYNGGNTTFGGFISATPEEQEKVKKYLKDSLLFKRIEVAGKKYHLSHGTYLPEHLDKQEMKLSEATAKEFEIVTWETMISDKFFLMNECVGNKEEIYIFGHKFVQKFSEDYKMIKRKNLIDIDCGCALGEHFINRLGLLRLDDRKEIYID